MERLEQFGIEKDLDFVFIPKQDSKSKIIELIVTDPIEGIHISREKEGRAEYLKFRTDLIDEEPDDAGQDPFGQVKYLALNARKDMMAMYCDADSRGSIVLLKNLKEESLRIEGSHVGASQLTWCGNDSIILSVFDQVVIIVPEDQHSIDLKCRAEGIFCK